MARSELLDPSGSPKTAAGQPQVQRSLEAQVWHAMLDVHGEIFGRLNRALGHEFGITLAKFDVLAQLYRFREGLTQGILSRHLKVTGGNVTGLVRRLTIDGLISREMSTTDRRAFIVRLTPQGAALFCAARDRHDALLAEWFDRIGAEELRYALNSVLLISKCMNPGGAKETK